MAILAVVLMIAPGSIPGVPRQVVAVGFVLAIVVTFGVLYWRHRDEHGDWVVVPRACCMQPASNGASGRQSPACRLGHPRSRTPTSASDSSGLPLCCSRSPRC